MRRRSHIFYRGRCRQCIPPQAPGPIPGPAQRRILRRPPGRKPGKACRTCSDTIGASTKNKGGDDMDGAQLSMPVAAAPGRLALEFLRYLMVGGLAFLVDYGVLWLVHSALGWHYQLATLLGFCAGLFTNYLLCVAWVWRGTKATTLRDFAIFTTIGIGGLLLTVLLMWLSVSVAKLAPELAKPFIAGIVLLWNFGLRRLFVFFR
ncbi:MAG: hypothetical protein CGU28_13440 [Candidatus Dactylopiibacterium carminicum]|nr:MAG: hypothetical protein CGU28_13440 [Candidatus Dactylopiibacterium carminicum]